MEKLKSYGAAWAVRRKISEAVQALADLETEKSTLPADTYLMRKQDMQRQKAMYEEQLRVFNEEHNSDV